MKKLFTTTLIVFMTIMTTQVLADEPVLKLTKEKTPEIIVYPKREPMKLWVPPDPKYNPTSPKYTPKPVPPCPSGSGCVFPQ